MCPPRQTPDFKRYEALREIGCIACHVQGFAAVSAEIHHIVDKGYRKHSGGNQATIPLCAWHHRGNLLNGFTPARMKMMWGPSMFLEAKEFARTYGSQRELLAIVNEKLRGGNRLKT